MTSKRFVCTFPPNSAGEAITCNLIRKFDIIVNIVKADITPGKVGHLVVEMTAPAKMLKEGIAYMKQHDVDCEPIDKRIKYNKDLCIHCGACTAVCFAGALTIKHDTAELSFDAGKCVVCELCLKACPLKLFSIDFD